MASLHDTASAPRRLFRWPALSLTTFRLVAEALSRAHPLNRRQAASLGRFFKPDGLDSTRLLFRPTDEVSFLRKSIRCELRNSSLP